MRFDVITLFGDWFASLRDEGVTGRAHRAGTWRLRTWSPRDYAHDVHRTVDDRPYGGGPGMVMQVTPLAAAVAAARADGAAADAPIILMSPSGAPFNQAKAQRLADSNGAVLVCARYEGVDQRFIDHYVDEEWSMGDFVLSGGEIPALAVIDATVRLLPGVLNDRDSAVQDSFSPGLDGLLDCPHYTRPERHEVGEVPDVLLSGDHARIARWRRERSLALTAARRPDLIAAARAAGALSVQDEAFLHALDQVGDAH